MALNYGDAYINGSLAYGDSVFSASENNPPVFVSNDTVSVQQGATVELTLVATDIDQQSLTYSVVSNANSWVTFDSPVLTISPSVSVAVGVYTLVVSVTDGINTVEQTISITVTQAAVVLIAPIKRRVVWDEQQTPDLVTGDDFIHNVQLLAGVNQLPFNVSAATSIKVCVTNLSHRLKLTDEVELSPDAIGADWINGLIVIDLPWDNTMAISGPITEAQLGYVEIEVMLLGNRFTWFGPVNLIVGQIE